MPPLKPYDSDLPYSYAPGVFPALELMTNAPGRARRLLLSERAQGEGVEKLRRAVPGAWHVREEVADRALARISGKENCFAAVVFDKWQSELDPQAPHVVLHHPMDEGNLGTIQRTLLGLGIVDLAVIRPAADPFDPRVVRATMGAVFSLRVKQYDSFEAYRAEHPAHALYPFMLDGSSLLEEVCRDCQDSLRAGVWQRGQRPAAGVCRRWGRRCGFPTATGLIRSTCRWRSAIGAYAFTRARERPESRDERSYPS